MALDVTTLKYDKYLRPTHLEDLIAFFNGEAENTYAAVDITTAKAAFIAAINTAIDTIIDSGDTDATKKTNAHAAILSNLNSNISNSYTVNKTDVFTEAKTQLVAAIVADSTNFGNFDRRCNGSGRYPANRDADEATDNTTPKHCPSCDGFGYTSIANTPSNYWSVTTTF
jgi:hypothetical protein